MAIDQLEYTYEPFAETPEYRAVNMAIVHRWLDVMKQNGVRHAERLLDIATGVGTMLELYLEQLPKQWKQRKQPLVICLDASKEALEQASARLSRLVSRVELVHALVEEMELPEKSVDVAVWGNGIHYLCPQDQEKALRAIRRVLKPGGWFCFNTAFYAESRPPETLPFYVAQVRRAVAYLRSLGAYRQEGEARAEASAFLPREHYENLVRSVGFSVEEVKEVTARLYQNAWEYISSFQQYAAGALRGYQPGLAAQAMCQAVAPALEQHGQRDEHNNLYIQRNWLAVIARLGTSQVTDARPAAS